LPVRLDAVKRASLDRDASRLTEETHKLASVLSPFSLLAGAGLSSSRRAGVDRTTAALERLRRDRADKPPFHVREPGFRRLRPFLPAAIVRLAGRVCHPAAQEGNRDYLKFLIQEARIVFEHQVDFKSPDGGRGSGCTPT
jgi:hypothetical protein